MRRMKLVTFPAPEVSNIVQGARPRRPSPTRRRTNRGPNGPRIRARARGARVLRAQAISTEAEAVKGIRTSKYVKDNMNLCRGPIPPHVRAVPTKDGGFIANSILARSGMEEAEGRHWSFKTPQTPSLASKDATNPALQMGMRRRSFFHPT